MRHVKEVTLSNGDTLRFTVDEQGQAINIEVEQFVADPIGLICDWGFVAAGKEYHLLRWLAADNDEREIFDSLYKNKTIYLTPIGSKMGVKHTDNRRYSQSELDRLYLAYQCVTLDEIYAKFTY